MTLRLPFQLLLLALITLGVYYPSIFAGLNPVDDVNRVTLLNNLASFDFYRLFFPGGGYYYRPITASTFYLDQMFWSADALFMHVENILLHLINTLLVFCIARAICRSSKKNLPNWLPLVMASAFALHPINTEAVCWISGRYDLLATTFILCSTWLLLFVPRQTFRWTWFVALLPAFLACLSKETALFFFGGAVALIFASCRESSPDLVGTIKKFALPFFFWCAGALAYLFTRSMALQSRDSGIKTVLKSVVAKGDGVGLEWLEPIRITLKVTGFYIKKVFFPWPLNFSITEISDLYVAVGVLALLVFVYLLFQICQGRLYAALFIAGILVGSAALLVVFGKMAWTLLAERYLYTPAAFFVLGWTAWMARCQNLRVFNACKILLLLFVASGSMITIQRTLVWSDPVALAEDTVAKSPKFGPARKDLANFYFSQGRVEEGRLLLEGTMNLSDLKGYVSDDISMAALLAREGKLEEAHALLVKTLENPGKQFSRVAEGILKLNHKRLGAANDPTAAAEIRLENVTLLERLIKIRNTPFLEYQLAKEYMALESYDKASALFESAHRRSTDSAFFKAAAKKLAAKMAQKAAERNED
ncbi:MAG: hypothetical protein OET90_09785 [Desulfuromonadales bacterium]|nr:hypothetical protein [Desulfuromonadales bacterium]